MRKIKILILSILIILLLSCSRPFKYVDKEIEPYYNNYMSYVETYCSPGSYNYQPFQVWIGFDTLQYPTLAYCSIGFMGSYQIHIDRGFWDRADNEERKQLVSHESQHCLFRVGHSIDPTNYMFAYFSKMEDNELDRQIILFLKAECER